MAATNYYLRQTAPTYAPCVATANQVFGDPFHAIQNAGGAASAAYLDSSTCGRDSMDERVGPAEAVDMTLRLDYASALPTYPTTEKREKKAV
jgi:hypothetical protein